MTMNHPTIPADILVGAKPSIEEVMDAADVPDFARDFVSSVLERDSKGQNRGFLPVF